MKKLLPLACLGLALLIVADCSKKSDKPDMPSMESQMLSLINADRDPAYPLELDWRISNVAREHARWLYINSIFHPPGPHQPIGEDGKGPDERVEDAIGVASFIPPVGEDSYYSNLALQDVYPLLDSSILLATRYTHIGIAAYPCFPTGLDWYYWVVDLVEEN